MPTLTTCSFGGNVIGDGGLRHSLSVSPNESPDVQTGVFRQTALLSDNSPNLTYMIRVRFRIIAGTPIELIKRILTISDLKLLGKQQLVISETIDSNTQTLTMDDALLVGEVNGKDVSDDKNPSIMNELVLAFLSDKRPY